MVLVIIGYRAQRKLRCWSCPYVSAVLVNDYLSCTDPLSQLNEAATIALVQCSSRLQSLHLSLEFCYLCDELFGIYAGRKLPLAAWAGCSGERRVVLARSMCHWSTVHHRLR